MYNILLIIDFQKQFIVDQQTFPQSTGYMENECIIEEDNEEDTDDQNTLRKQEEEANESEEEAFVQSNSVGILQNSQRQSQISSQNQRESSKYSKIESNADAKRNNEQDESDEDEEVVLKNNFNSNFSLGNVLRNSNYSSNQNKGPEDEMVSSSENEMSYNYQEEEEPVINKTLVMLQKELHKSLFSPSNMTINESPKVSLMSKKSKKIDIPNIFGMNGRPSSGDIRPPTSEESSRHSFRKDHLSRENQYQMFNNVNLKIDKYENQMQDEDYSANLNSEEDIMSLESIIIK